MASGRIRTDNFDNFATDIGGPPGARSREDRRKDFENQQKQLDPNWKPGQWSI
jgi:hypothetical protein